MDDMDIQAIAKQTDDGSRKALKEFFHWLQEQNAEQKEKMVDVLNKIPRKSLIVYSTDGRQFPMVEMRKNVPGSELETSLNLVEVSNVYTILQHHFGQERDVDRAAGYGIGVKIDEKLTFGLWLVDNTGKETLFLDNLEKISEMIR